MDDKLYNEFWEYIEQKHGTIAIYMEDFFCDFRDFLTDNALHIKDFKEEHLDDLFSNYLDYMELSTIEATVVYQIFIDLCDFCDIKAIDITFFRNYLLENKQDITGKWEEKTAEKMKEEEFFRFDILKFIEDFDEHHSRMYNANTAKDVNFNPIIRLLEGFHHNMETTMKASEEIKRKYPEITEDEYFSLLDEKTAGKLVDINEVEDINEEEFVNILFSLPKETGKKFLDIFQEIAQLYEVERADPIKKTMVGTVLNDIETCLEDIKALNSKHKIKANME